MINKHYNQTHSLHKVANVQNHLSQQLFGNASQESEEFFDNLNQVEEDGEDEEVEEVQEPPRKSILKKIIFRISIFIQRSSCKQV